MTTVKMLVTLGLIYACVVVIPVARADQYDQATELTFSQPVQIPGRVLPAGTYWFVLANTSTGNRNVIHIFNSDRSTLYATVNTITAERAQSADHTAFTFAERESTQPSAIVTWFYPGRKTGHEFVYPAQEEKELASAKHQTVVARAPATHQTTVAAD
jgi:Protein of unknown function (DUF2911)